MLLRPGNAGSNTFTDHKEVLAAALRLGDRREHRCRHRRLDPPPRPPATTRNCGKPTRKRSAYRVWHIPARLVHHARQRILKISPGWPWKEAFLACWQRLCAMPAPA